MKKIENPFDWNYENNSKGFGAQIPKKRIKPRVL